MVEKLANFDFKNYIAPVRMQNLEGGAGEHEVSVSNTLQDIANSTESMTKKLSSLLAVILGEREVDVIIQRFGLVEKKRTLAAIADDYGITRERVRQIEAKALRRCKILSHKIIFEQLLSEEKSTIQHSLFKKRRILSRSVLKVVSKNLNPEHKFLIALIDDKVTAWLTRNYYPTIREGVIIAWSIEDREVDSDLVLDNIEYSIPKRIIAVIENGIWPMPTSTLETAMPDVPKKWLGKFEQLR
jgi:DNA-binding phage protein